MARPNLFEYKGKKILSQECIMRFFLGILLTAVVAGGVYTQSNDIIDEVLSKETIDFGSAAYLTMTAAGLVPETADTETVLRVLNDQKWGFETLKAGDSLTIGDYSHLLMKAFEIPGGLWFSLFPGSRYALREMLYKGIVSQPVWPGKLLRGDEAVRILLKVIDWKESLK
jgi:hypothetical protein